MIYPKLFLRSSVHLLIRGITLEAAKVKEGGSCCFRSYLLIITEPHIVSPAILSAQSVQYCEVSVTSTENHGRPPGIAKSVHLVHFLAPSAFSTMISSIFSGQAMFDQTGQVGIKLGISHHFQESHDIVFLLPRAGSDVMSSYTPRNEEPT